MGVKRNANGSQTGPSARSSLPPSGTAAHLHCLSYEADTLAYLSRLIVDENRGSLPDLTHCVVLLSQARAAPRFRREMLQAAATAGHAALLGPQVETLSSWIAQTVVPSLRTVADETRELLLVEALREHPDLYGAGSAYSLAASLMELFDDLTAHYIELPDSLSQFQQQLEQAYGISRSQLSALGKETTLVHTLWQAMRRQLQEEDSLDSATAYIRKLAVRLSALPPGTKIYLAGFHDFTLAEWQWLKQLTEYAPLTLVVQGEPAHSSANNPYAIAGEWIKRIEQELQPQLANRQDGQLELDFIGASPSSALSRCLNAVFTPGAAPIIQRAADCAAALPQDPLANHIRIFQAGHAEAEANAVDIQVRRWLAQGLSHIGIVTENRRLARRVRALLERAGIVLQDSAGWALSTTSAATVIERWLQCIEEDFHYLPFLDFLKSPFVFADGNRKDFLQTVYRLEQSIVFDENVAAGLQRYRAHTTLVQERMAGTLSDFLDAIPPLLDVVEQAAQPLIVVFQQDSKPPGDYLRALLQSLQSLGVVHALQQDAAGNQLLNVIDKLLAATDCIQLPMAWVEFRAWLGSHLEHAFFQPANAQSPVQLMSLAQSDLQRFDALIIAGAEQQFLPGAATHSPFFNDAVRNALGLPTLAQIQAGQFYFFRRLLHSTTESSQPRILITRTMTENGEELLASPWLEAITSFHHLAYHTTLLDDELKLLVERAQVQSCDRSTPLPPQMPPHPVGTAPRHLLPDTYSATSYQQLMNCPYQFFAARCLRLSPPETVREMLQKDEYGNKVHLCLQAFHSKVAGLPGPYEQEFCEANKQTAIDLLTSISQQVFAKHIEDNFIHRGWLKRWLELIPRYVDWQIQQAVQWRAHEVEQRISRTELSGVCGIRGQLDRIDEAIDEDENPPLKIIDYKTGQVPSKDDVASGEAVQLPFYALLIQAVASRPRPVHRVEYLSLDSHRFGDNVYIEGVQLHTMRDAVAARLVDVVNALQEGQGLPAWGDSNTCKYCVMAGLCRKGMWNEA